MPRWEVEEHPEIGTIHILETRGVLATVRRDVTEKHDLTVVTVSVILPADRIEDGKYAVEHLFGPATDVERRYGRK